MKDIGHHLQYVQKKVLHEVRKEQNNTQHVNGFQFTSSHERNSDQKKSRTKFEVNHRAPKLQKRMGVH